MSKFKPALIAALIFTVIQAIYLGYTVGLFGIIVIAPLAGLLFGLFVYFFSNSKRIQNQTQITIEENQSVIKMGVANHFRKAEAVGGRLYLLNNCIRFKPHKLNFQNHELEIALHDVSKITTFNSLGLIPNGIKIHTSNGGAEKFVVTGRKDWLERFDKLGLSKKI